MPSNTYGMVGWEEFSTNRDEIINKFNQAKIKERSRKVKVEHGNVAEASVREWLESFLPKKYSVTSGYIIPNFLELGDPYNLGHFDVIIYDHLNSPILWIDDNTDKSEQGKSRAIPAQYVICVLEVKSNFTPKTANDVISKLSELNPMKSVFPKNFSCGAIYIELEERNIKKTKNLDNLNPENLPYNFFGGLVLFSKVDRQLTGYFSYQQTQNNTQDMAEAPRSPLIVSSAEMDVYQGVPSGSVSVGRGFKIKATSPYRGAGFHFNKSYVAYSVESYGCLALSWSSDNFVTFAIDLIGLLEGIIPMTGKPSKYVFGQIFDKLPQKNDNEFPNDSSYLVVKKPDE
jgi:hypothetical protein